MKPAPVIDSGDGVLKDDLRQHLSRTCPDQELRRWYDPLGLSVSESEHCCLVRFPHAYFATWFETSVRDLFEKEVGRFLGDGYAVRYQTRCGGSDKRQPLATLRAVTDFPYGHRFTFETFLANEKNHFPLALAREVAGGREARYNPFLLCGPSGAGKTHLLRAMANAVSRSRPSAAVFFGSIDDIGNRYADPTANPHEIRAAIVASDFLFIDELADVKRDPILEQELVLLFNAFHDAGKQMVFSCRERVASCDFGPTLKSRLEWGLMVHLKLPDLDVRVRCVEHANRDKRLGLSREQTLTLASRFEGFRQLEGVLLRIEAFRRHTGQELTDAELARHIRLSEDRKAPELTPERILAICAEHFTLGVADITGHSRRKELVFARQTAMALCRALLGMSYPALGKVFGGKDHSTVLYSIRKFQQLQDADRDTKLMFRQLAKKCRQGSPA
ncbi:Chromosomal replication initiator DnaA domain protein [Solidesulfovibrio fructosivorans JJ]]|uniref:Chromosomal replication initiator protein DnaA n=1 Tax=Solidesulfovibrio fructosivorans JJ] TaxID=596151 RepID=E1JVB1_SOLFR|nr:DnaA/Hda family protein [Solidesulfovibrio fructosivorans]EFL51705.1 Chromosomal replication initiator DnaA domain protein [Solidesulfovibrio fructosivorans JJ]]